MGKAKSSAVRRWVGAGVVCLLIGAGVAYGVAWRIPFRGRSDFSRSTFWNERVWVTANVIQSRGMRMVTISAFSRVPGSSFDAMVAKHLATKPQGAQAVGAEIDAANHMGVAVDEGEPIDLMSDLGTTLEAQKSLVGDAFAVSTVVGESGWPIACIRAESQDRSTRVASGTLVHTRIKEISFFEVGSVPKWIESTGTIHVPTGILWGPLAIDAVAWGFPCLAAWAGAGWWMRRRRVKRGLCVACGYDLKGDLTGGCPECGAGRGMT